MFESKFFGGPAGQEPEYNQNDFADFLMLLFRDGVFPHIGNQLQVRETDPRRLAVLVDTGRAWVRGFDGHNKVPIELDLEPADPNFSRIDRIVVRVDKVNNRDVDAYVITGTPSSNPAAPPLTRTDQVYDLSLAQVFVAAGATSISNSNITDERGNPNLCGSAVPWAVEPIPGMIVDYAAPKFHQHNASDINAGTLDIARIPNLASLYQNEFSGSRLATFSNYFREGTEVIFLMDIELPRRPIFLTLSLLLRHEITYTFNGTPTTGSYRGIQEARFHTPSFIRVSLTSSTGGTNNVQSTEISLIGEKTLRVRIVLSNSFDHRYVLTGLQYAPTLEYRGV